MSKSKFRDSPWWPKAWVNEIGSVPNPQEIRKTPVLKNVRRSGNELVLILEHNGGICSAKFGSQLPEDFLIFLRHILLQHWGKPISDIEDFEIDLAAMG